MEKEKIIIVGAGGHSKAVIDCINQDFYEICGILDKDKSRLNEKICGIPIVGEDVDAKMFYKEGITGVVVAIGHIGNFQLRCNIYNKLVSIGFHIINVIHNSCIISKMSSMGQGNTILAGAIINANVMIGNNNIINTGSIVEHDAVIHNNVHVAPGATICGMSCIGDNTLIGAGSTIIQGITIGKNVIIGAGSIVIRDIEDNVCVVGNPARILRER